MARHIGAYAGDYYVKQGLDVGELEGGLLRVLDCGFSTVRLHTFLFNSSAPAKGPLKWLTPVKVVEAESKQRIVDIRGQHLIREKGGPDDYLTWHDLKTSFSESSDMNFKVEFRGKTVELSRDELESVLKPAVDAVLSLLAREVEAERFGKTTCVLLAGGFANYRPMQHAAKQWATERSIRLDIPAKPGMIAAMSIAV